jgi:hypothetical protein
MKAFVLENNIVVNIISLDDDVNPADWGAVQLNSLIDFTAIGDTIVNGVSVEAATREADYQAALVSQPPEEPTE